MQQKTLLAGLYGRVAMINKYTLNNNSNNKKTYELFFQ